MKTHLAVIGWTFFADQEYPVIEPNDTNEYLAIRLVIVEEIRKNGYNFGGFSHQFGDSCAPVLNTGEKVQFSMRKWGEIMAEAHNEDDQDGYAYAKYAFNAHEDKEILPKAYVEKSKIVKKQDVVFPEIEDGYNPEEKTYRKVLEHYEEMLEEVYQSATQENMELLPSCEDDTSHPLIINMNLKREHFDKVYLGQKTIEVRLNDKKRQRLEVGDFIQFFDDEDDSRHIRVVVTALYKHDTFSSLFSAVGLKKCGFSCDKACALEKMKEYYSKENELKFGAIGIEFEIVSK